MCRGSPFPSIAAIFCVNSGRDKFRGKYVKHDSYMSKTTTGMQSNKSKSDVIDRDSYAAKSGFSLAGILIGFTKISHIEGGKLLVCGNKSYLCVFLMRVILLVSS